MPGDLANDLLEWVRTRHFGKYRGTVTDNADPAQKGRVKVQVPAILGTLETWAMPCVPYAGDGVGFYAIPEAGTGVWVEFEGGDPSFPIWSGCFWADGQLPDESKAAVKVWKTKTVTVRIDDDAKEISIETADGTKLTLVDTLTAEVGQAKLKMESGSITQEQGSAKVEVGNGAVSVNNGALEVR